MAVRWPTHPRHRSTEARHWPITDQRGLAANNRAAAVAGGTGERGGAKAAMGKRAGAKRPAMCRAASEGEGASEAAEEAVRQAVGGGCQSGCGAVTVGYKCHSEAGTWRQGDSGWA